MLLLASADGKILYAVLEVLEKGDAYLLINGLTESLYREGIFPLNPSLNPTGDTELPPHSVSPWLSQMNIYLSDPLTNFSIMLVNSIGKMNLVAAPTPIAFSVSKYCRVIVFWSTVCATE